MRQRLEAWLEETHGPWFELVRHFLGGFFDAEASSTSGDWVKIAAGLFAVLISTCILGVDAFWLRYDHLWQYRTATEFLKSMHDDEMRFIALFFGLTALLTTLQWQSLFPNRRDVLALASWPVSARQIFGAKFASLLLIFAVYVLTLTATPAVLFTIVTGYPWRENPSALANLVANFSATAGACIFAFFSLLALQGVLLNFLPGRIFARVSLLLQGLFFVITLGGLPLLGRWPNEAWWFPTSWFLHLWESILRGTPGARTAVLALTIPPLVTVLSYALAYHRFHRLLLEGGDQPTRGFGLASFSRLTDLFIRDPREQAAFAFISKTLFRSRSHRLILMAYAAIGLGCITKGALDTPRPSLHDQGLYGFVAIFAPVAIAILVTVGLRYLFTLPVAIGANWIFQTNEPEGRAAWLNAVERFVVVCGIAPVFVAAAAPAIAIFGPVRAAGAMLLCLLAVLIGFEILFRRWRKLPFTCIRVTSDEQFSMMLTRWLPPILYLATLGELILYCSGELTAFAALASFEIVVWWRLRRKRRSTWANDALVYEDQPGDAPVTLGLQQPREDQVPIAASSAPVAETPMFSTLSASRGFLPSDWQEEIDSGRAHPKAFFETCFEDIRYGLRVIRRNPVLSGVVVLTLTLGLGMNASVFTVVNGLALRAHVYSDPSSFVRIILQNPFQRAAHGVSYRDYLALSSRSRSLRQLAAWTYFPAMIGEEDNGGSFGLFVSCNFFTVDGLDRPVLGRLLTAEDCRTPGQVPSAILSESIWRSRFGGDPNIIGRVIQLNNRAVPVMGVVPDRTSNWTIPVKIWVPYTGAPYLDPAGGYFTRDEELWISLAGRLARGFSREQAQAELNILVHQLDTEHSGRRNIVTVTDGSWIEELELTASGRDLMLVSFFLGSFFLVLVIACANVATLLLSRAAARKREIAVRLSLGAPRVRLIRMLVTESLLLASIAGVISLLLTWKVPKPLFHAVATGAPDFPMPPDWRIFLYLFAAVLTTGVLAGLAPAIESVKVDLLGGLKGYSGSSSPAGGTRLRGWLVGAQVSLSMVLLVEAAMFAQSENRTLTANPGYMPQRVVVAPLRFEEGGTADKAKARLDAIKARLLALHGARSVAFSDWLPMMTRDTVELRPPMRSDASQPVDIYSVSPGFLQTMGISLASGRDFVESDGAAVVVSKALADLFWWRQNPVGKTMPLPNGSAVVVGVANDVAAMRFGGSENPAVYRLRKVHAQFNWLAVRFDSDAVRAAPALRAAIHASDPDLFVFARPLQTWIDQVTTILWNVVALIIILGCLATVLASAGIYGAVSFAVRQRNRELGIRVALGAQRTDIVREIFASCGRPVVVGLLQGLWMAVAVSAALRHAMSNSPIRLDTTNPLLYGAAAVVLAGAAAAAMIGPARRGSRSDPLDALRCE
jgi:predicted permease